VERESLIISLFHHSQFNEDFNEKIKNRQGTPLENKGMRLFTLLPVKSSFTMSNILIDRTAIMDLILGDKGRSIGEALAGLYKTVRKLVAEDYMSVLKPFFMLNGSRQEQRSMFISKLMGYQ
jgi:hypothetical protein